ncbi:MAG TPA: peptide ABC transporter substrate-binding protein [Herpetosiphonaceae bacterium]
MRKYLSLFLLCALLLTGCGLGGSAEPTTAPAPAGEGEAETVGGQGNLILTLGDDPATLDPPLIGDVSSAFLARQLFSGLVRLSDELEAVPDLAGEIKVSDDERVYTFLLRADAAFADGTPITADDVRWSLERATDPATGPVVSATYLDDIDGALEKLDGQADSLKGLKVVDDRTLEITLRAPSSLFLLKLTNPPSFVVDRRAVAKGDDWTESPNGSGPFVIDSWEHRRRMELVPNARYYGAPAKLGRVTFLIGAEGANQLGLYENGDVDVAGIGSFDLDRVNNVADPLHGELRETPQLALTYLAFNVNEPPFDDPKVREAFSLLIDRNKLAEVSFNGTVAPGRGVLPPTMPGADPAKLPEPTADAERARQLLAESSYGSADKLPPIVGYTSSAGVSLLAQIAKDELGVNVELRSLDRFGSYLQALRENNYTMYDLSWIADYPDPQNFLEVLFGANSPYNRSGYNNPEFESLIAKAKAEPDEAKRGQLYREAEQLLMNDHVVIPLYHSTDFSLVKPYVDGLTITPLGILNLTGVSLRR